MKRIKALVAGLALGGLVGLLFAPKKGSEFRKELKKDFEKGNYGMNAFRDTFMDMGKDMSNFTSDVAKHEEVQEYLVKGKKAAKDVQKRASLWLEANYGITDEDIDMARKQLSKKAGKMKTKAKKAMKKAKGVAGKVTKQVKKEVKKMKK
ncbi:MAG TPA: YtxH domain-containing protein [Candidatus Gracilibacteria bacterium]|nr:YtxH domain-containing protein [Candidatus Gracilibacteria bacterium]